MGGRWTRGSGDAGQKKKVKQNERKRNRGAVCRGDARLRAGFGSTEQRQSMLMTTDSRLRRTTAGRAPVRWLLLASAGYCWLLLATAGFCWLQATPTLGRLYEDGKGQHRSRANWRLAGETV